MGLKATKRLAPAGSWVCQLQHVNGDAIAASDVDIAVVAGVRLGSHLAPLSRDSVELMKQRPGPHRKRVLAHVCVCEVLPAESWVSHGKPAPGAPAWLDAPQGARWRGAWQVKFWDPDWQRRLVAGPDAELEKIIALGFDGILLEGVDAFAHWMSPVRGGGMRPLAANEMIAMVAALAEKARRDSGRQDFAIVPLNGLELLKDPRYRMIVSAVAVEQAFRGASGEERKADAVIRNAAAVPTPDVIGLIQLAQADRLPILAIEYPGRSAAKVSSVSLKSAMMDYGLMPFIADPDLKSLEPA